MMTTRVLLPYSDDPAVKPAWYRSLRGAVMVRCACGVVASLANPVTRDGVVELHHEEIENGGCGWHAIAILEGWGE